LEGSSAARLMIRQCSTRLAVRQATEGAMLP
jgi:hypothetical protein